MLGTAQVRMLLTTFYIYWHTQNTYMIESVKNYSDSFKIIIFSVNGNKACVTV